jgi:hypothetical protein
MELPPRQQFEHLYDTYVDAIFHYLAFRLNDRERAKELTHEVFIRVWGHLSANNPLNMKKLFCIPLPSVSLLTRLERPTTRFHSMHDGHRTH